MTDKKIAQIEASLEEYWDEDYLEVDFANQVAEYAQQMVNEIKRLQSIIEDADTEASLRRHDSFEKINKILSKVNINA